MKQQFLEILDRYIAQGNWDEKQLCRQIRLEVEKEEDKTLIEINKMINTMIEKAEEHKENKRLDLARNTLDIVYAFKELKFRLYPN